MDYYKNLLIHKKVLELAVYVEKFQKEGIAAVSAVYRCGRERLLSIRT